MPVSEYEEAVLRLIQSRELPIEGIIEEFEGVFTPKIVKDLVRALKNRKYIKIEQHLSSAVISAESDFSNMEYDDDYVLTPLGKNYLANSTPNFTSFNNISNSNISHQSSNVNQVLQASELPDDIREKIQELQDAILKKDKISLAKAFAYIADKSVDIAIALLVNGLGK